MSARTLVVHCPSWPLEDAGGFDAVVDALSAITPTLACLQPGCCAMDARASARPHGGEQALVMIVERRAGAAAGRPCRAGIADGLFAAGAAARLGRIVPAGGSAAFLAGLPISTLPDPDVVELCIRLGVRTLGAFVGLGEAAVTERFGLAGRWCRDLACGGGPGAPPARPPGPPAATFDFDPPAGSTDEVAFAARRLAYGLVEELQARGLGLTTFAVTIEWEERALTRHSARTWHAELPFGPAGIVDRVRWQLEGWRAAARAGHDAGDGSDDGGNGGNGGNGAVPAGIARLGIACVAASPAGAFQGVLEGGAGERAARAERALARVDALLAGGRISAGRPAGGRHPAEVVVRAAWRGVQVERPQQVELARAEPAPRAAQVGTGRRRRTAKRRAKKNEPAQAARTQAPWPGRVPTPLPAVVHPQPPAAVLTDADGRSVGVTGRGIATTEPALLAVAGGPAQRVVAWSGPWPCEERWWDAARRRRRAYMQAVTGDGAAWLLALDRGSWRAEALYD